MLMKRFHQRSKSKIIQVIRKLLYQVKHSRPDIANAVGELSKVLHGANMAAYKKMHQIIKYVLDSRDFKMQTEPIQGSKQPWETVITLEILTVEEVSLALFFMCMESQ